MEKAKNIVLESTKLIIKKSKDVKINSEAIKSFKIQPEEISSIKWDKNIHFYSLTDLEKFLNYLLLIDCNNFCFWKGKEKKHFSNSLSGYLVLTNEYKNFFISQRKKANLKYFSKISFEEFKKEFKNLSKFQLFKKRWEIVRRVSLYMVKNYNGSFYLFLKSVKKDAAKLIKKISQELYSFNDSSQFQQKKIYFLKRAQHLTANIWGALEGKDVSNFYNLEYLTAMADYKLPQILNYLGILQYSQKLKNILKKGKIIKKNSSIELELRANTIWAIEQLKNELNKKGISIYSFQVDWYLWNKSHCLNLILPHHRTKTFYY